MDVVELPLISDNQTFSTTINGATYQFAITWRGTFWALDLADANGDTIISGIPLITGADLLGQYKHLGLGFSLIVLCDAAEAVPTQYDLGSHSRLYVFTE